MFPTRTAVKTIMFQNGVVTGAEHSLSQIQLSSHGKNASDSPKRPSKLPVLTPKVCVSKAIQEKSEDADQGSSPGTPEITADVLDVSARPAGHEAALDSDTRQLLSSFMAEFTATGRGHWRESRELATMKRVVGDLMEKHRYVYNGMIKKLSLDEMGDDTRFVSAVAQSMFSDGTNNWGRIASLVAFGAVVAQQMKESGRKECVEQVAQEISSYLLTDQRDWLIKNNAWEGFVEFFQVSDPESTVRNVLMAVAGVAGIGATLALLIR